MKQARQRQRVGNVRVGRARRRQVPPSSCSGHPCSRIPSPWAVTWTTQRVICRLTHTAAPSQTGRRSVLSAAAAFPTWVYKMEPTVSAATRMADTDLRLPTTAACPVQAIPVPNAGMPGEIGETGQGAAEAEARVEKLTVLLCKYLLDMFWGGIGRAFYPRLNVRCGSWKGERAVLMAALPKRRVAVHSPQDSRRYRLHLASRLLRPPQTVLNLALCTHTHPLSTALLPTHLCCTASTLLHQSLNPSRRLLLPPRSPHLMHGVLTCNVAYSTTPGARMRVTACQHMRECPKVLCCGLVSVTLRHRPVCWTSLHTTLQAHTFASAHTLT